MAAKPGTVTVIDHGYDEVMREIKKLNKSYTAVGWFGRGGSPENDVAARAYLMEKGATIRVTKRMRGFLAASLGLFLNSRTNVIRIPGRPFISKTYSLYKRKVPDVFARKYNELLANRATAKQVLGFVGEWYVGRIKYVLTNVRFAPNHPVTVRKKRSSKPLIDTGEMRNSTTHREIMK